MVPKYTVVRAFSEEMCAINIGADEEFYYDGKWGFIDKTGKEGRTFFIDKNGKEVQ